jgi:hypothetical protein
MTEDAVRRIQRATTAKHDGRTPPDSLAARAQRAAARHRER